MFSWFETHARAVQAISGAVGSLVAVIALVGVAWQVSATYQSQREQSARDIYRDFLSLSVANPDFAEGNYCALKSGPRAAGYHAYVQHLLYTIEQMLDMDPTLQPAFRSELERHAAYLCDEDDYSGFTPAVVSVVADIKQGRCEKLKPC